MPDTDASSYPIVIERADDGGYGAWAPDLPGCVALGDTFDDCERQMREAIAFDLEGLREHGEPVPPPNGARRGDAHRAGGLGVTRPQRRG